MEDKIIAKVDRGEIDFLSLQSGDRGSIEIPYWL